MKSYLQQKREGFTIVELAVVITIIAILTGITIVVYPGMQNRTAETQVKADLQQASMRIEAYKANNGGYPASQDLVDGGKGLPRSVAGLVYDYAATAGAYCLSATTERTGNSFKISNTSSEVVDGDCAAVAIAPIALVGSQSSHTGSTNSATLTIMKPSGIQEGDLMLIVATMVEGSRSTADFDTIPGWTLINSNAVVSPDKIRQSVWYKVATASEPVNYTVTAVSGSSCKIAVSIGAFSSVDTASPIMAFGQNVNAGSSATAEYGSVTATGKSYLVALGGGRGINAFTSSAPAMSSPYSVASSARTTAASWMYSYIGNGEELMSGTTAPPNMAYEGTMTTNMTHSVLLRART